ISDFIKYEVADIQLTVGASGRVLPDLKALSEAQSAYAAVFSVGQIARSQSTLAGLWNDQEDGASSESLAELESATLAEWGISLRDQASLIGRAVDLAAERRLDLVAMSLDGLTHELE